MNENSTLKAQWFALITALLGGCLVAAAQPFGTPGTVLAIPDTDGYVEVPSSPSLNPANAITIEFWGSADSSTGIISFLGKGFHSSYWVGSVNGVLSSFLTGGTPSLRKGGQLPFDGSGVGVFAHIAVTYDGHVRKHYIDGELVGVFPETGALQANSKPLRLGSDPDYTTGSFDNLFEVRLWNVARTQSQIRQFATRQINDPMPGLVAVWHLQGTTADEVGGHNGEPPFGFAMFAANPTGLSCGFLPQPACFVGSRFQATVLWQTFSSPGANGQVNLLSSGMGSVVPGATDNSAVLSFFQSSDWELLLKMPASTCALNNKYWVFSAAATNVHYRVDVYDLQTGTERVYLNYSGPPAPAVNDTAAFATCP